jgi:hypothetical protein
VEEEGKRDGVAVAVWELDGDAPTDSEAVGVTALVEDGDAAPVADEEGEGEALCDGVTGWEDDGDAPTDSETVGVAAPVEVGDAARDVDADGEGEGDELCDGVMEVL